MSASLAATVLMARRKHALPKRHLATQPHNAQKLHGNPCGSLPAVGPGSRPPFAAATRAQQGPPAVLKSSTHAKCLQAPLGDQQQVRELVNESLLVRGVGDEAAMPGCRVQQHLRRAARFSQLGLLQSTRVWSASAP